MKFFNIISVSGINSTNDHLRELHKAAKLPEGTVILADFQHKGKGRGENSWYSGNGMNILMSILLFPKIKTEQFFFLTEMVSLALIEMLSEINIKAKIKWPNDIYVGDKKIGGILIENTLTSDIIESSIIGVGLNVNEEKFPDDLPNPVSIKNISGKDHNREVLTDSLLEKLSDHFNSLLAGQTDSMHTKYNTHLFRKKQLSKFSINGIQFEATIYLVQKDGMIVLETTDGEQKQFAFGELEMLI